MLEGLRLTAAALCLVAGVIIMIVATIGVFRFHFVLNRMHAAAMGDTLGMLFILLGLIIKNGLTLTSAKLLMIIVFFWFASPVCSHLVSKLEVDTHEHLAVIDFFQYLLLICLILCAVSVGFTKNLLTSIVIFMSYSLVMSIIWVLLESPDLAITEAAVGAGVTSLLFFVTLKKIHAIEKSIDEDQSAGEDGHEAKK